MSKTLLKPGMDNQSAGTYVEVGPRGGQVPNQREVKIDLGDKLPPTSTKGNSWIRK